MNTPDLPSFFFDNPANLDLPLFGSQPKAGLTTTMPTTNFQTKTRSFPALFSSCSLSLVSHVVIAFLGLMLTTAPQLPVYVMSLDLMPTFVAGPAASGASSNNAEVPVEETMAQVEPAPEPEPTPPPVEEKPVQPIPEPVPEKVKPIPQKPVQAPKKPTPPKIESSPAQTAEIAPPSLSNPVPSQTGTVSGKTSAATKSMGHGGSAGPVASAFGDAGGPSFVRRVMPKYPEMARRRGLEGMVVLRLVIGVSGELKDVQIVEGAERYFEEAALAAVKASRYAPATKNGQSIECSALLPIRFALRGS